MTAAVFDRVPVDEITRRARHAKPGRAAATVLGGILFGVAFCIAGVFRVVWLGLAWCYMACDEGWRQAVGTRRPGPDIGQLRAELAQLRAENLRLGGDG